MRSLVLVSLAGLMLAGPALADDRHDDHRDRHEDRREWHNDRRDWHEDRWEWRDDRREWNQRDIRWNGQRYRAPVYAYPRGNGYRPWAVGYRLPPAYYGAGYWIEEPAYYRLPPPYRGTRWVRVGPDALLISIGNGIIVQAVRGLYW